VPHGRGGAARRIAAITPDAFDILLDPTRPSAGEAPDRPLVALDDYTQDFIAHAVACMRQQQIGIVHIHNFS
jgi:hypothetical protein